MERVKGGNITIGQKRTPLFFSPAQYLKGEAGKKERKRSGWDRASNPGFFFFPCPFFTWNIGQVPRRGTLFFLPALFFSRGERVFPFFCQKRGFCKKVSGVAGVGVGPSSFIGDAASARKMDQRRDRKHLHRLRLRRYEVREGSLRAVLPQETAHATSNNDMHTRWM